MSRPSRRLLLFACVGLVHVAACRATDSLPESGAKNASGPGASIDSELAQLFEELERAVRENPEDADARGRLAMARHANGLFGRALEDYEQAIALAPSDPKWWYLASLIHADRGDFPEAIAELDSARVRAPATPHVHWRQGLLFLDSGELDAADVAFGRALELRPNLAPAKLGRARVLLQRGNDAQAAALLEGGLERKPDAYYAPYFHQLLGTAYRKMGRVEEARVELAQGAGGRPTYADPWSNELTQFRVSDGSRTLDAAALIEAGENEKAAKMLEEVRAEGAPTSNVLNYLSVAYMNLGRIPEAKSILEEVIERDPDDAIAHTNLSLAFSKIGDDAAALRLAERAVTLNPWLSFTHVQKARVLQRLGRREEARDVYDQAIRLSPSAPEILLAAAGVSEDLERWKDVDSLATRALERDPRNVEALVRRGRARTNLGMFHDARDDLTAAAALRPGDAEIQLAQEKLMRRAAGPPGGRP